MCIRDRVSDAGIQEWSIIGSDEKAPEIVSPVYEMKDDPTKLPMVSHVPLVEDLADAILNDRKRCV